MRVKAQREIEKSRKKHNKASPKEPEDFIPGMVIDRLRAMVGVRYEDIEEWTASQGRRISSSSICEFSGGIATKYMGRIPLIARYFREVHGLEYVTTSYLMEGDEVEKRAVEIERSIRAQFADTPEPLPLFDYAEQTA